MVPIREIHDFKLFVNVLFRKRYLENLKSFVGADVQICNRKQQRCHINWNKVVKNFTKNKYIKFYFCQLC